MQKYINTFLSVVINVKLKKNLSYYLGVELSKLMLIVLDTSERKIEHEHECHDSWYVTSIFNFNKSRFAFSKIFSLMKSRLVHKISFLAEIK